MKLALKVDVDTYRGTREGVPRLAALFERHGVHATFLFSLGPDHTGRAIRRAFRPGFLGKVARTSVLEHYGLRTLLYGTLLPGPDIGRQCAATMRSVREAGHETGIHCWDHARWQDGISHAGAEWTGRELGRACARFAEIFGEPARVHGAAGWQINVHALRLFDRLGFACASDTRGTHPYLPVCGGERYACPQLPTTLPTLDELIATDGRNEGNLVRRLLDLTAKPKDHVFTAHAELEGRKLIDTLGKLLAGWKAQSYQLVPLRAFAAGLDRNALPRHEVISGSIPGRSGMLALQGREIR